MQVSVMVRLLGKPIVQKELSISKSVREKVDGEITRMNSELSNIAASRMPMDQLNKAIADVTQEAEKRIVEHLSDDQSRRLRQVTWHSIGPAATRSVNDEMQLGIEDAKIEKVLSLAHARTASGKEQIEERLRSAWNFDSLAEVLSAGDIQKLAKAIGNPLEE